MKVCGCLSDTIIFSCNHYYQSDKICRQENLNSNFTRQFFSIYLYSLFIYVPCTKVSCALKYSIVIWLSVSYFSFSIATSITLSSTTPPSSVVIDGEWVKHYHDVTLFLLFTGTVIIAAVGGGILGAAAMLGIITVIIIVISIIILVQKVRIFASKLSIAQCEYKFWRQRKALVKRLRW